MIYPWQQQQWQAFTLQQTQQRLAHAILLSGHQGLGKLSLAAQMAKSVLCTESDSEACGNCHSCQLFVAGTHPDHSLITPEDEGKQIKIEQIRQLKNKQQLTPTVSKWKTVIIEPADMMNISSNNSLLKLLEEPQANTLLVLITSKPERLPITLKSRCQKVVLNAPNYQDACQWIQQQGSFDAAQLEPLLSIAKGAPLQALNLSETDVLQHLAQIDSDFELMLRRQANPVTMAKDWQQYNLMLVLNHLQYDVKKRLLATPAELNVKLNKRYWAIYDCIIRAIKLTSSANNINKILLVEQFIVSVMDKHWNKTSTINF